MDIINLAFDAELTEQDLDSRANWEPVEGYDRGGSGLNRLARSHAGGKSAACFRKVHTNRNDYFCANPIHSPDQNRTENHLP